MSDKPFFDAVPRVILSAGDTTGCGCVFADVRMKGGVPALESGSSVPELLAGSQERKLILNIADGGAACVEAVRSAIVPASAERRVLITSPHAEVLRCARKALPSCASAFTPGEAFRILLLAKTGLLFLKKRFEGDALILPEYAGGIRLLSGSLIRELRSKGVHVFAWGADGVPAARRLLNAGADAVITGNTAVIDSLSGEGLL